MQDESPRSSHIMLSVIGMSTPLGSENFVTFQICQLFGPCLWKLRSLIKYNFIALCKFSKQYLTMKVIKKNRDIVLLVRLMLLYQIILASLCANSFNHMIEVRTHLPFSKVHPLHVFGITYQLKLQKIVTSYYRYTIITNICQMSCLDITKHKQHYIQRFTF